MAFSARKLRRVARFLAPEPHHIEGRLDACRPVRDAPLAQPEFDVFARGEMRKQRVILKNRADVSLVGAAAVHQRAVQPDLARGRLFEPGDHPQRRGLAAARGSKQRKKSAFRDPEGDSVDRQMPWILLRQVLEFQIRVHWKKYSAN